MPVHPKFTREQVIDAAYDILRKEGVEALTARHLGESMGSSARPVFTLFLNMNEVKAAAMTEVRKLYAKYIDEGMKENSPILGVTIEYIRFAIDEPHLFRILFMSPRPKGKGKSKEEMLRRPEPYEKVLESLQDDYDLDEAAAADLYENMRLYTHGIATLAATSGDGMDMTDVGRRLTMVLNALVTAAGGRQ